MKIKLLFQIKGDTMKKLYSLFLCIVIAFCFISCSTNETEKDNTKNQTSSEAKAKSDNNPDIYAGDFSKTAKEVCSEIVAGWNLGNTLDACQSWGEIPDNPTPAQQETGWNNPVTTQDMINKVANTGFNAIRVPVTWGLQIEEKDGKYIIKEEWMNRVKEVAEYCLNADCYTVVNMHHDDQTWLNISASDKEWEIIKEKYRQLWEQIANEFKDYGEKLIFEGANEITATNEFDNEDCYNGSNGDEKCWWGHSQKVFDRQNELYKIFFDTVRNSGGNNAKRYLMVPTYGAQWYENQIDKLYVPEGDTHVIMDVHWYQADTSSRDNNRWVFSAMRNFADENNIGTVLGESGMMASYPEETKTAYAENVIGCAKEYDIPVFLWDDGGDVKILERNTLTWNCDAYVNEVIRVAKETKVEY